MESAKATINRLYGSGCLVAPPAPPSISSPLPPRTANATSVPTLRPSLPAHRIREVTGTSYQDSRSLVALSQRINNLVSDTGAVREYVVNIRANAIALGGTFTIFIFDGPVTASPITWKQSNSLLGWRTFLTSGKGATKGKSIVGTVTMTSALMGRVESGILTGMGNDEVAAYLKDKMTWKIVKGDGTSVSPKDVPGLAVSVITSDVQPATHERELPSWGTSRVLDEVTLGKPGGYSVNSKGFIGRDP